MNAINLNSNHIIQKVIDLIIPKDIIKYNKINNPYHKIE